MNRYKVYFRDKNGKGDSAFVDAVDEVGARRAAAKFGTITRVVLVGRVQETT